MRKLTIKEMQEIAKSKDGICLSDTYVNEKLKLKWQCEKGHVWEAASANIKSGKWCPHCGGSLRLTIEEMQKIAESKGGKCLSNVYKNLFSKLRWQCSKGHIWETTPCNVKNNKHWCPYCAGNARLTLEDAQKIAEERYGKCLSETYKNIFTKMKWQCSRGHVWEAKFADIKNDNNWCPECSSHKTERICRKFFEYMFEAKFPKVRPKWLKSTEKTSDRFNLELDGYNEQLKLAFEYHGHQHFIQSKRWHEKRTLEMQKARDEQKRQICKANGVTLIEIPYTIKFQDLQKFIIDKCTFAGISPKIIKEKDYRSFDIYLEFPIPKTSKERHWERKNRDPEKYKAGKRASDQRYLAKYREKLKAYHIRKYWERKGQSPISILQKNENYLENLRQIAKSKGGKCISTTYIKAKAKLEFECKEGHRWFSAAHHIKEGHWCPKCTKNMKLTLQELKEFAKIKGGKCLSDYYTNAFGKLKWKCKEGHIWESNSNNIRRGKWCPVCYRQRKKSYNHYIR